MPVAFLSADVGDTSPRPDENEAWDPGLSLRLVAWRSEIDIETIEPVAPAIESLGPFARKSQIAIGAREIGGLQPVNTASIMSYVREKDVQDSPGFVRNAGAGRCALERDVIGRASERVGVAQA